MQRTAVGGGWYVSATANCDSSHPDNGLFAMLNVMKGDEHAEQRQRRVAACRLLQMLIKERDADCDTVGVDDEESRGLTGWRPQVRLQQR
jgi:hypothetical protein